MNSPFVRWAEHFWDRSLHFVHQYRVDEDHPIQNV